MAIKSCRWVQEVDRMSGNSGLKRGKIVIVSIDIPSSGVHLQHTAGTRLYTVH